MNEERKGIYTYMTLASYKKATPEQYQSVEKRADKLRPEIDESIREKEDGAVEAAKLKVY